MRAPDFWDRNDAWARFASAALLPLGRVYGASVAWKAKHAKPWRASVPVICVGNLTAGGAGKTPVAIAVARALIARGRRPFFLTRGYGGLAHGPLVVRAAHAAALVGDEPLMLAEAAPVVVSRDRARGARLAIEHGAQVIVMDDGHQNFALAKDLSLVVVDAERGFGNGRLLPAGPLRESVQSGLARADAVILMGEGNPPLEGFAGPVLRARLEPAAAAEFQGRRVVAFAGIGRPEKFFRTLAGLKAQVVYAAPFADHHRYTSSEIAGLKAKARDQNAQLVTTEKDFVRLAEADRRDIAVLRVRAVFADGEALSRLLDRFAAAG